MSDAEDFKKRALWAMQPVKNSMNTDRVEPVAHTQEDVQKGRAQTPGKMDFSKEIPIWPPVKSPAPETEKGKDSDQERDR